ncbi:hypothetical protein RAL98_09300 [Staphylococcus sp. HKU1]
MLYLSLITSNIYQFSMQQKTLDNLEKSYEKRLHILIKEEDIFGK